VEADAGTFEFCQELDIAKVPQAFGSQFLLANGTQNGLKRLAYETEHDVTMLVRMLVNDASIIT
jgi:hypothetical protein